MISNYLQLLYSHNKVLVKTTIYNCDELIIYFNQHINSIIIEYNFINEAGIIDLFNKKTYNELTNIFNKSKHLHIFYLVNCFNEYNAKSSNYDQLGRYKFSESPQKQNNITNNTVLNLIISSVKEDLFLQSFFIIRNHKSYFYLSHDIDSVYGSLSQDGLWAIKKGRIDILLKLFINSFISNPEWFNFDLIMKAESEFDFKSTFYWLTNSGKIDKRQTNADYKISSKKIISAINKISNNGFENGLHKSISKDSFNAELLKMPLKIIGNRYHYLKFKLPNAYKEIEESGLKLDASLGFAEHFGFRNGYGYPFHPYNLETNCLHSFLEVPLTIMDGTFQRYLKIPVSKTAETIIDFLEKHNQNALISILWHNTFFSNYKYKGYLNEYKKILSYLYDSKFQNINQGEIIEKFSWQVK